MLENKNSHIDSLLGQIRALEQRVVDIKTEQTLPFSFFNEAFNTLQRISSTLRELEQSQIGEMKGQMEKLVAFLSEAESHKQKAVAEQPEVVSPMVDQPEVAPQSSCSTAFTLPTYCNPKAQQNDVPVVEAVPVADVPSSTPEIPLPPKVTPVGDFVKYPHAPLELQKTLSLNDRFLYQRELFNNNRDEMNGVMMRLNAFDNYPDAEQYLREQMAWDFDSELVQGFLNTIRNGYK